MKVILFEADKLLGETRGLSPGGQWMEHGNIGCQIYQNNAFFTTILFWCKR